MKSRLERLSTELRDCPDKVLYAWSRPDFESPSSTRLEFLSLLIMSAAGGSPTAYRLYGASLKDVDGIWRVVFQEDLVRIKSGIRRNLVVPLDALNSKELGIKAGLQKMLVCSDKGIGFSESRKGDSDFLKTLETVAGRRKESVARLPMPQMNIVIRDPARLIPRHNKKLMSLMTSTEGYSSFDSFRGNYKRMAPALFHKNGESYICDYELVFGRGMMVADMSALENRTFAMKLEDIDLTDSEYCRTKIKKLFF